MRPRPRATSATLRALALVLRLADEAAEYSELSRAEREDLKRAKRYIRSLTRWFEQKKEMKDK